jgi:hypothetical protein
MIGDHLPRKDTNPSGVIIDRKYIKKSNGDLLSLSRPPLSDHSTNRRKINNRSSQLGTKTLLN